MTSATILGFGEIGKALHAVLSQKSDITLECWDKNIDILPTQKPLQDIVPQSDIVFLCVPTWLIRSALQSIHEFLKPGAILVSVSKGFEKESCTRIDALIESIVDGERSLVFIGGPMIAEELVTGARTRAIAASANERARETVGELFHGTSLAIDPSDDLEGIVTAASLKNIYALGLGISDALNLGANAHGVLLSLAAREMMHIVVAHGGRAESALGFAGLGDLVATSQSPNSTNYTTGVRFARGLPPLRGSEALNTLPCIAKTMEEHMADMPFLSAIVAIVEDKQDPKTVIETLLR